MSAAAGAIAASAINTIAAESVFFEFALKGHILPVDERQICFAGIGDTVSNDHSFGNIFDGTLKFEIFALCGKFVAGNFYIAEIFRFIGSELRPTRLQRKIAIDRVNRIAGHLLPKACMASATII